MICFITLKDDNKGGQITADYASYTEIFEDNQVVSPWNLWTSQSFGIRQDSEACGL